MARRLLLALAVSGISALGLAPAAAAAPTQLVLSQSAAFSILGHDCGGIQEKVYASTFRTGSGAPRGNAYIWTRCGRYVITTYSAWVNVTWSFAGATLSYAKLSAAPTVNPNLSIYDAHGDHLYNQNNQAYVDVLVAAAPTNVAATPSGGQWQVSWSPDPTASPALITSSIVTATPVSSTTQTFTATVSGNGASAIIGPLEPKTTYQITVVSNDAAGPSSPSAPLSITTGASTIPPGAPTGLSAHWTAPGSPGDALVATWKAAPVGDSPTDEYQVTISGSDGAGTFSETVSGSTLSATFAVSDVPDWTIRVRAHDAAGWGPWSSSYTLGGA